MKIAAIHHVSLAVTDLEVSRRFYRDMLLLEEIARPPFAFAGAWFAVGNAQQLHLIVCENPTLRAGKGIDTTDTHFALRVESFETALAFLKSKGFREDASPLDPMLLIARPKPVAGFPQIYILDPDRHLVEINAERLE